MPGNNANPGTQAAPKQNLTGINLNTLPAGVSLLFARGGAWGPALLRVENMATSAASPLTFADYGTGSLPLLRNVSFELGGGFNNQTDDGGYVFRSLRIDGGGTGDRGIWLRDNVRDVVLDGAEVTGWRVGIASQTLAPFGVNNITVKNSRITNNREEGWLGKIKSGLTIEDNVIEGNNPTGNGFWHGLYIGGADNLIVRRNRFIRNSVNASTGLCSSGGLTLHGEHNNTLVEGNLFEQTASSASCWQMSITAGYSTPEFFRNLVVRGNTMINGGNGGIVINSAPGALVEGNILINTQTTVQRGVVVGQGVDSGDDPGAGATVRNNTACYPTPHANSAVAAVSVAGATVSGNVMRTGADATTGVCAR